MWELNENYVLKWLLYISAYETWVCHMLNYGNNFKNCLSWKVHKRFNLRIMSSPYSIKWRTSSILQFQCYFWEQVKLISVSFSSIIFSYNCYNWFISEWPLYTATLGMCDGTLWKNRKESPDDQFPVKYTEVSGCFSLCFCKLFLFIWRWLSLC